MYQDSNANRVSIQLPAVLGGEVVYAVRDVQVSRDSSTHGQWTLVNEDGSPVAMFAGKASRQLSNVRQWIKDARFAATHDAAGNKLTKGNW